MKFVNAWFYNHISNLFKEFPIYFVVSDVNIFIFINAIKSDNST